MSQTNNRDDIETARTRYLREVAEGKFSANEYPFEEWLAEQDNVHA